jgi:protein SDA1
MYTMLRDSNHVAAKMSLDALTDLYKKNVWRDTKTVNVIATACLSPLTKVMVGAIKFFLGTDEEEDESSDSDDEDKPTARELVFKDKVNKKTNKRKRKLERAMAVIKKHKKKKNPVASNFSALHLLHDPQDFAEKLFKQLEKSKDRFEVKVMILSLISRLIGVHKLFVFNFYPFVQRFLQPHQRDVTKLLMYTAQACHGLVPAEVVEPALMAVVNNFITERNSSEVMAVGLNAVREMCARCPLIMKEDLLRDLAQYKSHRNKNVVMAARSLIQLYRGIHPDLLHKKDRGRLTMAAVGQKPLEYGELEAKSFVPGTELLTVEDVKNPRNSEVIVSEEESDDDDDDSGDEIIENGEDTGDGQGTGDEELPPNGDPNNSGDDEIIDEDTDYEEHSDEEVEVNSDDVDCEEREVENKTLTVPTKAVSAEKVEDAQMTSAEMISQMKLLTPADFKTIRKRQLEQELQPKVAKKQRKTVKIDLDRDSTRDELVSLGSIETVHKSAKLDKQARLARIMAGREDRPKFKGGKKTRKEFASTSHKEKQKSKNFLMMRTTRKVKQKSKRSFREKQIALRNSLLKNNKRSNKRKR